MGYAATTIAFFGVRLDHAQAQAVDLAAASLLGPEWFYDRLALFAEGADSRVHNLDGIADDFEIFDYAFGIKLGSHGYGRSDDIGDLLVSSVSDPAVASEWAARAAPILAAAGLPPLAPKPLAITQVW